MATSGTHRRGGGVFASASAIASAAGAISAQWKGAETGSSMARFTPLRLGDLDRPLDRAPVAGDHHLAAAIVVGRLDDLSRPSGPSAASAQISPRHVQFGAEQGRHGALAGGHRLLHRLAAQPQQPRGVGDGNAPAAASALYSPSECPADQHGLVLRG